jgi:hypothetical protein
MSSFVFPQFVVVMPLGRFDSVAYRTMRRGVLAADMHGLIRIRKRISELLLVRACMQMLERLVPATRLFALLFTFASLPVRHLVLHLRSESGQSRFLPAKVA